MLGLSLSYDKNKSISYNEKLHDKMNICTAVKTEITAYKTFISRRQNCNFWISCYIENSVFSLSIVPEKNAD